MTRQLSARISWIHEPWELSHGAFGWLLLARTLLVSASFASLPYLAVLLTDTYGFSLGQAASLLMVGTLAARMAAFPAGVAVDYLGVSATLIGASIGSLGCLLYLAVAPQTTLLYASIALSVQGLCVASQIAGFRVAVPTVVPEPSLSLGFSMSEAARIAGKLLGPCATVALIATGSYRAAFLVSGFLYGCGGVCAGLTFWRAKPLLWSSDTIGRPSHPTAASTQQLSLPIGMLSAACMVYAVANIGITQMTTWMPKYFDELGYGGAPPLIFALQSVLAIPLLLLTSSYGKHWTPRHHLAIMSGGVLGMALAYLLLSWLAARDVVLAAGFVVCSALFVELAVLPVVHTFIAQVMPAHRLGFGFGFLGLSDVGGTVVGIMVGTSLYTRAQQAGNLSDYWHMLGVICTILGVVSILWGLLNPGWASVLRSFRRGHSAGSTPITEYVRDA